MSALLMKMSKESGKKSPIVTSPLCTDAHYHTIKHTLVAQLVYTGWGISKATEDLNRSEENIDDPPLFFSLKMVTLDLPKIRATVGMVI